MLRVIEVELRALLRGLQAAPCREEPAFHKVPSGPHNVFPENAGSAPVPGPLRPFELPVQDSHKEMKLFPRVSPHYQEGTAVQSCPVGSVRDASPDRTPPQRGQMQTTPYCIFQTSHRFR